MMMIRISFLLIFVHQVSCCLLMPDKFRDEIHDLPGLNLSPSFRQYAGYLNASYHDNFFYWFVEAEKDPSDRPLILWLNGGPGCSSVDGLLSEHGPFLINSDGTTLRLNPYSWNKVANVIYMESPAGVGFSYGDEELNNLDDATTAEKNFNSLIDFYRKFPEYIENELYIAGESYGGVYAPALSQHIVRDGRFNFKGFLAGNGYSEAKYFYNSWFVFLYHRGILSQSEWDDLVENCCTNPKNLKDSCEILTGNASMYCLQKGNTIYMKLNDINKYNVQNECYQENVANRMKTRNEKRIFENLVLGNENYPCINTTAVTNYLNTPSVRRALHVSDSVDRWQICNHEVLMNYERTTSVRPYYLEILQNKDYRAMIYNGDDDFICNYLGDLWFADSLGFQVTDDWRKWYTKDKYGQQQVAGFTKQYGNLYFATIKGGGHSAPIEKPYQSLEMLKRFINEKPL